MLWLKDIKELIELINDTPTLEELDDLVLLTSDTRRRTGLT